MQACWIFLVESPQWSGRICLANASWHVMSQFARYMTKRVDSGCHVTMYSNRWVSRIAAISEKKTKKSHHCACRGWCYAECSAVHFSILLWSMFCMACPSQPNDMLGACFCLVIHHDDWVGTSIACFHYTSFCVVLAWYHAQEWYIPLHHILRLSSKWHAWRCYHCLLFVHAIRDATLWKHTSGVFSVATHRFTQDTVWQWVEHNSHAFTMHDCVAKQCVAFVQWVLLKWLMTC